MFDTLTEKRGGAAARGRSIAVSLLLHGAALGAAALFLLLGRQEPVPDEVVKEPPTVIFHPPRVKTTRARGARGSGVGSRVIRTVAPTLHHVRVEKTVVIEPPPPTPAEPEPPAADPDKFDNGLSDDGTTGEGPSGQDGAEDGAGPAGIGGLVTSGPPGVEEVHTFGLKQGMTRPIAGCRPPAPLMPEQARSAGIDGKVTVAFVVHADGHVGEVREVGGRAPRVLLEAVERWLLGCGYQPSMLLGRPVAAKISQTFEFKLR